MADNLSIKDLLTDAREAAASDVSRKIMNACGEQTLRSVDPLATPSSGPLRIFFVVIDGVQQGPFSQGEIAAKIQSTEISLDTFCWKAGMGAWKPMREIEELQSIRPSVPPEIPK